MHLTHPTEAARAAFDNASVQLIVNRLLGRFRLSKRETEATILLAQGLRAKQIAHQMSCSEKTVYAHLARVCKKTGRRDQHELVCVLLAFACNLVDTPAAALPDLPASVDSGKDDRQRGNLGQRPHGGGRSGI